MTKRTRNTHSGIASSGCCEGIGDQLRASGGGGGDAGPGSAGGGGNSGAAAVGERFYVIAGGRTAGLAYSDLVEWWAPDEAEPTPTRLPTATVATTATAGPTPTGPPVTCVSGCWAHLPFAGRDWNDS